MQVGDFIIMKPIWLSIYGVSLLDNKAEVIEYEGVRYDHKGKTYFIMTIRNKNWGGDGKYTGSFYPDTDFYFACDLNREILQLISNGEVQITHFVAKTADGKQIHMSL